MRNADLGRLKENYEFMREEAVLQPVGRCSASKARMKLSVRLCERREL